MTILSLTLCVLLAVAVSPTQGEQKNDNVLKINGNFFQMSKLFNTNKIDNTENRPVDTRESYVLDAILEALVQAALTTVINTAPDPEDFIDALSVSVELDDILSLNITLTGITIGGLSDCTFTTSTTDGLQVELTIPSLVVNLGTITVVINLDGIPFTWIISGSVTLTGSILDLTLTFSGLTLNLVDADVTIGTVSGDLTGSFNGIDISDWYNAFVSSYLYSGLNNVVTYVEALVESIILEQVGSLISP